MLGSTLERVALPDDLVARLEGKSSLGRLGLLIHSTAGFVDAGWDGHLTLELSNVATLPIALYPGMKIGQISFLRMTTPADHPYGSDATGSKYQGQRGPTPSRYYLNFRPGDERLTPAALLRGRAPTRSWSRTTTTSGAFPQHDDRRALRAAHARGRAGRACAGPRSCASARATAPPSPASTRRRWSRVHRRATSSGCSPTRRSCGTAGKIESHRQQRARGARGAAASSAAFDDYVWGVRRRRAASSAELRRRSAQLPTTTDESTALSKDLKRRGFRFVGPTTVYAFMQAAGLVDDHVATCFRR